MKTTNIFMTCEWKDLIIANFEVDQSLLLPYLPVSTELDLYRGKALISLVAFTFSNVKFLGVKVPFHQRFGQINFRFYVKSKIDGSKGVVFLKEYAPRYLIVFVGNKLYNEPYYRKTIGLKKIQEQKRLVLKYQYKDVSIKSIASSETLVPKKDTLKHFIIERYIAFIKNKKRETVKYHIYHKPWKTYTRLTSNYNSKLLNLLPPHFKHLKHVSTYLVNGSKVKVQKGILQ